MRGFRKEALPHSMRRIHRAMRSAVDKDAKRQMSCKKKKNSKKKEGEAEPEGG